MKKDIAKSAKQSTRSGSWRTIRVFISSTFRDMHAERDYLGRIVFPELKEMCRKLRVHLIDVDLRWGVSEADAEQGKAIDICMDEIDTCRPYFLGLLGHRYGYIPPGHPHSITAEEIYHGVLHNDIPKQILDLSKIIAGKLEGKSLSHKELDCLKQSYLWDADRRKYLLRDNLSPEEENILRSVFQRYSIYQKDRSYFFFRSESFTRVLAGDNPEDFFEPGAMQKLQELKAEIREAKLPIFEYDDLEQFGQLVRDVLWARIEAEAKEAVVEKDWLEQEAEFHELFRADRTRRFVGRRELLERMHAFSESGDPPSLLVITGEPGGGKSALMARFAEETIHRHPDWLVMPHFVGASPASTNLRRVLRRFCTQLNRALGSTEEAPEDIKELLKFLPECLAKAAGDRPLLVIIDAVNQLEKGDNAHSMSWLPQALPANVRFVVSTLAGETQDALLARAIKPQLEMVLGLSRPEIRELVKAYLAEIRHEFPNPQVEAEFFNKVQGGNPLYILVALEELRVFGKFEELENRIRQLPGNVPGLFAQVIERIESDFNPALVRDCLVFMACGRQGMTAEELQTLLRQHASGFSRDVEPVKLPDLVWRRLYRSMSAYLFERSGVIDFFHGQLKEAVGNRYLSGDADLAAAHHAIADYFESRWSAPYIRALDELPHQRTRASDWIGLERVLCDLKFIEAKSAAKMAYDLVADYNAALSSPGFPAQTCIRDFARFTAAQRHVIDENPALTFQQAINEPDTTPQAQAAAKIFEAGKETRTFFYWINKPQAVSPCLMTLIGHDRGVTHCAFSPDGSRIVSASDDKTLKIWDAATGKELATLTGHSEGVHECAFSPDGSRLVSASNDKTLKIWDAATGKELATLTGHSEGVHECAFSPDGSRLVSASWDKTLKLWDAATGKELAAMIGHGDWVLACTFSPDGSRIVSASRDKTLKLWDAATGKELTTLTGHREWVNACAFSPDGLRIVSASDDQTLKIWDAATGRELSTLTCPYGKIKTYAFSPDGSRIVLVSRQEVFFDDTLELWDAATGKKLATLTGHRKRMEDSDWVIVCACTFSPDGSLVASASRDKTLKLWDAATGKELATLTGHSDSVYACAFSPDGSCLVSASRDKTLKLWDVATGREPAKLTGHIETVETCAFSPDGSCLVSASWDKTLKLWDAATGKELFTLTGHNGGVDSCTFSPNGSCLVSASWDKTLRLWDAATGRELTTLTGHRESVEACAFSPDGSRIASASWDKTLKLWDAATGKELATLTGHRDVVNACAFSLDGSRLVSASRDRTLILWDVATESELATLTGHSSYVEACSFSPDGTHLISASNDRTLILWDMATGSKLFTLTGHSDCVSDCAFSPDGSIIVSASCDQTLKLWDAATGRELTTLTGHSNSVNACAFSPDGSRIASASGDETLKLWDAATRKRLAEFRLNSGGGCLDWSRDGRLAVGTGSGLVQLLQLENVRIGPYVTTAWRKSIHKSVFQPQQNDDFGMGCPFFRTWSVIAESDLGKTIPCPQCGKSLQLNPFTINADWHPIARAWEKK